MKRMLGVALVTAALSLPTGGLVAHAAGGSAVGSAYVFNGGCSYDFTGVGLGTGTGVSHAVVTPSGKVNYVCLSSTATAPAYPYLITVSCTVLGYPAMGQAEVTKSGIVNITCHG